MTVCELYWQYRASARLIKERMKEVDQKDDALRYKTLQQMLVDTQRTAQYLLREYGKDQPDFVGTKSIKVQTLSFRTKKVTLSLRYSLHDGPVNRRRTRKTEDSAPKGHRAVDSGTEGLFDALLLRG